MVRRTLASETERRTFKGWALIVVLACATVVVADDPTGTFSLVAIDPATGEIGVAVQSRAFSVGGAVPWAEAGVGAVATQASTNESFGPRGLALLRSGHSAREVLDMLIGADEGRDNRQLGIVDAHGGSASFTGSQCMNWAGDTTATGLAAQGNILAGPEVLSEMVRAYNESDGELAERMLAALHAAQAAGGDRRGQQSAALLIVRPSDRYPEYRTRYIDLRVEDHATPIDELERVFRIHQASDLLRAHVRYAAEFEAAGNQEAANLEHRRIGQTLDAVLADEDASAGTLNALAWFCATADLHLDRSLEAARRAVAQEPDNTGILDTLAEVLFRMDRKGEALEVIERALAIEPEDGYLVSQRDRFMGRPAAGQPDFVLTTEKTHNKFSRNIEPVLRVPSGSRVEVHTKEATDGQITPESTVEALAQLDFELIHPLTGPIHVEGAQVGDVLAVTLHRIEVADWGWAAVLPGFGLLADEFPEPYLKIFQLDGELGVAHFSDTVTVPLSPFPGVMGVAPATDELLSTIPPRANGGNMDNPFLGEGTTVYFPVFVDGALFSIGDTHAAQGMGEVCGTAIEAPMKILLELRVLKGGRAIQEPEYETDEFYAVTAFAEDLDEAVAKATRYMIDYLVTEHGFDRTEAYVLCSVAGDLQIAEVVDVPHVHVAMHMPKHVLAGQ